MTAEAAARTLYANTEGNGVTGYVAATGQTYVCSDAANDPHYIEGADGARSSLTIALRDGEQIIGTFNVESPQLHGISAPRGSSSPKSFAANWPPPCTRSICSWSNARRPPVNRSRRSITPSASPSMKF